MPSSGDEQDPYDDAGNDAPSSPSSDHNSWSSADTARAAPEGSPGGDDQSNQRRPKRCKISREQLNILIKSFDEEPLPNFDQRQALAKVLGMTPRSVQIWFQNRRQRLKPMQPKSSAGMGDLASTSQLNFRRAQAAGQGAQQSFGMPGLAAVAGLCNGYGSDLMMSKAMGGLPINQCAGPLGSFGMMNGLPYDVMEPFAATKALLGAGYQPPASLALSQRLAQQPHGQPLAGCSGVCGSPGVMAPRSPASAIMGAGAAVWEAAQAQAQAQQQAQQQQQQQAQQQAQQYAPPASAPAATPAKAPQADGLLLLLACAGDGAPQGQPAAALSAA